MSWMRWRLGFLAVAGLGLALACGSDDSGGDGDNENTGGSSVSGTGGTGATSIDARCPQMMPLNGKSCAAEGVACPFGNAECSCTNGSWDCHAVANNGTGGTDNPFQQSEDCPDTQPATASECSLGAQEYCWFDGVTCVCVNSQWSCNQPTDNNCPESPPRSGDACQLVFARCDYDGVSCRCTFMGEWSCQGNPGTGGTSGTGGGSAGGALNGGATSTEGGTPSTEGGSPSTEGGTPSTQGGMPSTQGGTPSTQGGTPSTEGGAHSTAGSPSVEAGGVAGQTG